MFICLYLILFLFLKDWYTLTLLCSPQFLLLFLSTFRNNHRLRNWQWQLCLCYYLVFSDFFFNGRIVQNQHLVILQVNLHRTRNKLVWLFVILMFYHAFNAGLQRRLKLVPFNFELGLFRLLQHRFSNGWVRAKLVARTAVRNLLCAWDVDTDWRYFECTGMCTCLLTLSVRSKSSDVESGNGCFRLTLRSIYWIQIRAGLFLFKITHPWVLQSLLCTKSRLWI